MDTKSLFSSWEEIRDWAKENNLNNLVYRLQLNNDCWMSSGEFGRDQKFICDSIRFASSKEQALEIATEIDSESESYMKW